MSLAIDVDDVVSVLLSDGEWYGVQDYSFTIDSYEYLYFSEAEKDGDYRSKLEPHNIVHGGGSSGITASGFGFKWTTGGIWMYGPLSAIVSVKVER
jgi:hypothetical protein|tara:strand:- start:55 stop:342 length:288 start_codon:yes stop_codon:yes gene_type:complete